MQRSALLLVQASAAAAPGAAARAELGLEDDYYSTSVGQRERMLAATERLNKTGNRIQQGQQQLLETEVHNVSCGRQERARHHGMHVAKQHLADQLKVDAASCSSSRMGRDCAQSSR